MTTVSETFLISLEQLFGLLITGFLVWAGYLIIKRFRRKYHD